MSVLRRPHKDWPATGLVLVGSYILGLTCWFFWIPVSARTQDLTGAWLAAVASSGAFLAAMLATATGKVPHDRSWLLLSGALAAIAGAAIASAVIAIQQGNLSPTPRLIDAILLVAPLLGTSAALISSGPGARSGDRLSHGIDLLLASVAVTVGLLFLPRLAISAGLSNRTLDWLLAAAGVATTLTATLGYAALALRPDRLRRHQPGLLAVAWAIMFAAAAASAVARIAPETRALAVALSIYPLASAVFAVTAIEQMRGRHAIRHPNQAVVPSRTPISAPVDLGWFRVALPYVIISAAAALAAGQRLRHEGPVSDVVFALSCLIALLIVCRQILRYSAIARANRRLHEAQRELARQANLDPVTELPNRRALIDRLSEELERARRYKQPLSVCFVDVDRFKQVNDTDGHAAGDLVLREVGRVLRTTARTIDVVGRYGGEEFLVIVPGTWSGDALILAERLRRAVAVQAFEPLAGTRIRVTVSVGVAGFPEQGLDLEALLERADEALYTAKRAGRNQAVLVEVEIDEPSAVGTGRTTFDLLRLADLVEDRAPHLLGHAERTSLLLRQIGFLTTLSPDALDRLALAARLHDVGKIAIPDALLVKREPLTARERALLQTHPIVGSDLVSNIEELRDIALAIRHHHERWDGTGYPDGLAANRIPLAARLIGLAEAFDAMTGSRPPNRPALSIKSAIDELHRGAGTQFDPSLVEKLVEVLATSRDQTISPDHAGRSVMTA